MSQTIAPDQLSADIKAVSLDERDSLVRRAVWQVIELDAYTDDLYYSQYPVAVYEDYVIVRIGTLFFKASYVVTDLGVTLQPRTEWVQVEQWVEVASTQAVKSISIKSQTDDTITVAGYGLIFGDSDLYGDTFAADTDFHLDMVPHKPVFYDHTLQEAVKHRLGTIVSVKADDKGLWIEAQLDRNADYCDAVLKLIEQGALGWSSGSIAHLIRKDGPVIKSWPVVEWSLTPTPAEPRTLGVQHIKAATDVDPQATPQVLGESATSATDASSATSPSETPSTPKENPTPMEENENKTETVDTAAIKNAVEEGVKSALQAQPPLHTAGFVTSEAQAAEKENTEAIKSFGIFLRTGVKAVLNEATPSQGGIMVPIQYSNEITTKLTDTSILRAAGARVITVEGTNSFKMPVMTNSGAAVLTGESGTYDEQEPTFADVTFTPYKYTRLSKATDEVLADARFDVMRQILMPDALVGFAAAENAAFTIGTGSGQPQGVVTGASLGVTAASATAITADEVVRLFYSLGYLYRSDACWLMNDATAAAVRLLKDGQGRYMWQDGLQAGQPPVLLGRPVYTLNAMDTIATSKKTIVFGDLSYFVIADFAGLSMARLNELYAANGQVGFRWFKRFDSHVLLSEAIKYLQQA